MYIVKYTHTCQNFLTLSEKETLESLDRQNSVFKIDFIFKKYLDKIIKKIIVNNKEIHDCLAHSLDMVSKTRFYIINLLKVPV